MDFAGEIDDTVFWNGKIIFHSYFPTKFYKQKQPISKLFQTTRTADKASVMLHDSTSWSEVMK